MEQPGPQPRPEQPDQANGPGRRPGQDARERSRAPAPSVPAAPPAPAKPAQSAQSAESPKPSEPPKPPAPPESAVPPKPPVPPKQAAPPKLPEPAEPHQPAARARNDPASAAARQPGHPVVIGYDGSPSSRNALAYAAGMARRLARPLLVVYVVPFGVYCEPMTGQVICALRDRGELDSWLLSELDQVCDREGLEVSVMARRGNAAKELAAAADSSSADALVVGAPGRRLHRVAGSIPSWLARHARCPVIVVP